MNEKKSSQVSHRDFMRARRPELYSDTLTVDESSMNRNQFEYHLDTLTQRKEEILFENFARVLAEKELCPNLLPQTGPTGGGDSKVDTETYPVSEELARRWYEGSAHRGAVERWAFAISAKKTWRPKVQSDVKKIAETGRAYSLIYFITNQSVKDKDRGEVEDALRKQWNIDVRILDRTWIVDRVTRNQRWNIVQQTLGLQLSQQRGKVSPGPLDAERLRDLAELDAHIESGDRYIKADDQLAEDCLRTALLARGLGNPRMEVDGRFDQAERFAEGTGDRRQLQRIWYQRAWTAVWWFDDYAEADRIYDRLAAEVLSAEWIWEIEDLVNLWLAAVARRFTNDHTDVDAWSLRTEQLQEALKRIASDTSKKTNSLWSRTQLLLMALTEAVKRKDMLPGIFKSIRETLEEARDHLEFPIEPLVRLIRELGQVIEDVDSYDELLEMVIALQGQRLGNGEEGAMRLERANQKLKAGKTYDAIDQFSKAQILLAQDERKDEFVAAVAGTGLAYQAAGLLWAARANFVFALDRCLYAYFKQGKIDRKALPLVRQLIWVEIQLGRVPYVLCWVEWLHFLNNALSLSDVEKKTLQEELDAIDRVLGILVLRTQEKDWHYLDRIADVFEKNVLLMSRAATLFMLGHEDRLREEYRLPNENFEEFFSVWLRQPAAEDLPAIAQWNTENFSILSTVLLGCKVEVIARGGSTTVLLAESLMSFLEAFFSTAIQLRGYISPRTDLRIEVRQSDQAKSPFSTRVSEDNCGETTIVVSHPISTSAEIFESEGFKDAVFGLFARFTAELQFGRSFTGLEEMFSKHRAPDRAFLAARSILAVDNILGHSPKYRAFDWSTSDAGESFVQLRSSHWIPIVPAVGASAKTDDSPLQYSEESPIEERFGVDGLKHRDLAVISPINMPLWDKARWSGTGFVSGTAFPTPHMLLIFASPIDGKKIFRGWQKKIGSIDSQGWLGITIITGISRLTPSHYRVAVSISESFLRQESRNRRFTMVARYTDMTPDTDANLIRFLSAYNQQKRFILQPGSTDGTKIVNFEDDALLGIALKQLTVIPAWKIESSNPIISVLGGIEDPVIPSNIENPPILRTLERLKSYRKEN